MRNFNFEMLIIAFVAASFLWTLFNIIKIKVTGIEAEAVVTRLEEHDTTDVDGLPCEYYEAFVRFQLLQSPIRWMRTAFGAHSRNTQDPSGSRCRPKYRWLLKASLSRPSGA